MRWEFIIYIQKHNHASWTSWHVSFPGNISTCFQISARPKPHPWFWKLHLHHHGNGPTRLPVPRGQNDPITVRRKMTEESSLSWSPDHNKSRNETRRPLNRLLPEDSGLLPHSNMLVTDVYYEDSTQIPHQLKIWTKKPQPRPQTSSSTTKPELNPTAAANASTASTGSATSASIKVISQTTQPLFNGKTGFFGCLLNQNLTKC